MSSFLWGPYCDRGKYAIIFPELIVFVCVGAVFGFEFRFRVFVRSVLVHVPGALYACDEAILFRSACRLRAQHVDTGAGGEETGRPCSNPGIPLSFAAWNVVRFVTLTRTMVLFNRQVFGNNGAIKSLYRVYKFSNVISFRRHVACYYLEKQCSVCRENV
jgi:hypothetical protein